MPHYRHLGLLLWITALALVTWTLSQMPLASISSTLAALNLTQWWAWATVNALVIMVSAARWHVLSRALAQPVSFIQLLIIRQAGQTISFITPGPQFGGEPFQIYWLYKRAGIALHSAVLSLGLDRFYELWVNFLMLMLGAGLLLVTGFGSQSNTGDNWLQILLLMILLLLFLSVLAFVLIRRPQLVYARLETLSARWLGSPRLKKIDAHWQSMGADLRMAVTTGKAALLNALLLSLAVWVLIVAEMWLVLGFFDIRLNISGLVLILVAMRLALLLPLPGGIGTLEASVFWSFQLLQLPPSAALAVIALMRVRDIVVLAAGLICIRLTRSDNQYD